MTLLLSALLSASAPAVAAPGVPVRIHAIEEVIPCVQAALNTLRPAASLSYRSGAWNEAGPADVFIATAPEITRLLETGRGDPETDRDWALVPWLLQSRPGPEGARARSLDDVERAGEPILLPAGATGFEARRALEARFSGRVREARESGELAAAPLALVPASLPGRGDRVSVALPPLALRVVLAGEASGRAEPRRVLDFLVSGAGRSAFDACVSTP